MERKASTSLRLSPEAKRLLRLMADKNGITMTAMLEIIIRNHAESKGVK